MFAWVKDGGEGWWEGSRVVNDYLVLSLFLYVYIGPDIVVLGCRTGYAACNFYAFVSTIQSAQLVTFAIYLMPLDHLTLSTWHFHFA